MDSVKGSAGFSNSLQVERFELLKAEKSKKSRRIDRAGPKM